MRTIADTGPIVALLNRRDEHHGWVMETLRGLELPFWTCEAVLTEAAYLTGKPDEVLSMVSEGSLRIGLDIEEQSRALERLLKRYKARMDFADACVVRMSELFRESRVFTLDRTDFTIYRRNGREVIPLLTP